jgi:hypothetical protein
MLGAYQDKGPTADTFAFPMTNSWGPRGVAGSSFLFPPDLTVPEHAERTVYKCDSTLACTGRGNASRAASLSAQEKLGLNRFWSLSIAGFTEGNCWQYIPQTLA